MICPICSEAGLQLFNFSLLHDHDVLCIVKIYKIQEPLFNVGSHVNFITLAHLSYFPTNKT